MYNLNGFPLWCPRDGASRKLCYYDVAQMLPVVIGQLSAYFGTRLQNVALIGVENVNITVFVHSYVGRHSAQVVAYQVHYGGMFGGLLPVCHQNIHGIGDGSVQRSFHGV